MRIAVIGAGIQGICAALALRRRGREVILLEGREAPFSRASLRNEGKIHLGFVYANDRSHRTSELMLQAAFRFAPLLEGWLGKQLDWPRMVSHPFQYVIARESMVPVDELLAAYHRLEDQYRELRKDRALHYLGLRADALMTGALDRTHGPWVTAGFAEGLVPTVELAVDRNALQQQLVHSLAAVSGIELQCGRSVREIARTSSGFALEGTGPEDDGWQLEVDAVVNCAWEGRLQLDRELGLTPSRPWVYRLKHRLLGRVPAELSGLPSMTLVLGPFGDVVTYPNRGLYVSWYPTCMRGWSDELTPPAAWEPSCSGQLDVKLQEEIKQQSLEAFGAIVPALHGCPVEMVDGGMIFSWGATDIDQPDSELHQRHEIGIQEHDGYFSINTGKFTCGPYFANELVTRMG